MLVELRAFYCCHLFVLSTVKSSGNRVTGNVRMATGRFVTLSLEELKKLQRKQRAKNTDRTTQFGVNLLQKYLVATGSRRKVEDMQPEELNNTLISFYPGARTEKGERYKLNTLKNLRFILHRYFSEKRGVHIISDPIFNPWFHRGSEVTPS